MLFLEYYNYTYHTKQEKKDFRNKINDIINKYYLKYVYDYKIVNFELDINSDINYIELSIFGYGKPNIDEDFKKEDALIKFIFEKQKNKWIFKFKKSKTLRKIQNRDTEIKMENISKLRDELIEHLNKNKKI